MEQGTAKLDMLHGSIWDKLLRFALPVAATAALGQLFNAADVAVVGNFASGSRTAAVAANGPIINLILGLFIGIALGATVVIANAIGNNDRKSAQNAVHTSLVMAVVGGVIVAIIGELIAGKGSQFDATLVEVFLRVLQDKQRLQKDLADLEE